MSPKLLHLWGPLFINAYGLFIALGVFVGTYCASKDKKLKTIMSSNDLITFFMYIIIAVVFGGRLLFILENFSDLAWIEMFEFWQPGYSMLGSLSAVLLFTIVYLKQYYGNNLFLILDRITLYAPLTQSIARLGCYVTGCCYGTITTVSWAVVYTHPDNLAPLYTLLHPTQLYSAGLLFMLFIVLQFAQRFLKKPGALTGLYLMGAALERFLVDFLRADKKNIIVFFSHTQIIAIVLFVIGLFFLYKDFYEQPNK
jgi:phosphatidylglycerol---prolipoprotein diacylglyceryl transferase